MPDIITIDGPSGVGKGSLAKFIAEKLDYSILDSGALYRLLALKIIKEKTPIDDIKKISKLTKNLNIEFINQNNNIKILLDNLEVTNEIRTEQVAKIASQIATIKEVRQNLLKRQRDFVADKGLVADGRDMGTKVFPQARLKLFLTANSEERTKRRLNQLQSQGINASMRSIFEEIEKRDARDSNRKESPLIPAKDALILDTSDLSLHQVIEKVLPLL